MSFELNIRAMLKTNSAYELDEIISKLRQFGIYVENINIYQNNYYEENYYNSKQYFSDENYWKLPQGIPTSKNVSSISDKTPYEETELSKNSSKNLKTEFQKRMALL